MAFNTSSNNPQILAASKFEIFCIQNKFVLCRQSGQQRKYLAFTTTSFMALMAYEFPAFSFNEEKMGNKKNFLNQKKDFVGQ